MNSVRYIVQVPIADERRRSSFPRSIGVIGVGLMGGPMTMRILANRPPGTGVVVHGRHPLLLDTYVRAGAHLAASPADLAARSEVILVMLPDLPHLQARLGGPSGLLAGVHSATTLVICSTTSPDGVRDLGERLYRETAGQLHVVDAPVSGGVEGAAEGSLSIMVGGTDADYEGIAPVMQLLGTPAHLGPLGSGQVAKACNQMVVAATVLALAEASVIAERSGLDLAQLLTLFQGGYAASRVLDTRKQRFLDKDYEAAGPAKFMVKDLTFATAEAERTGTRTDQLALLLKTFTELTEQGLGDHDIAVAQAFVAQQGSPTTGQ